MIRIFALLAALVTLAACTAAAPDEPLEDLGAFKLGHNIVIASKVQMVPGSREVSQEEWIDALKNEVDARFSQYDGDQLYHFGISVEGYFVAPGGVPLVLSPKSVLAINVTVWDDAAGSKLNQEVKKFTVFETTTADSFLVGSGHARTREEQILGLARNAIGQIEDWMVEQHKENGWFDAKSTTAEAADTGAAQAADATNEVAG
ncbi:hypothetical protein NIT7321_03269 [Phaeobacter italicus]|jgi:outer membrane lipoprotein-sorting protein|uniref:Lipoprotein n=1 Tax=Phaeobacter italicus TaxID=481446 RepID=A0A0H5DJ38_9RHOB|nr:hypothetical protein [Phaeobacter italicus]CRL12395.1 hypothetical protein NIT7321_03269 [Phaeobacter italicus]